MVLGITPQKEYSKTYNAGGITLGVFVQFLDKEKQKHYGNTA